MEVVSVESILNHLFVLFKPFLLELRDKIVNFVKLAGQHIREVFAIIVDRLKQLSAALA